MTPRTRWSVCTLSAFLLLAFGLSTVFAQGGPEDWLDRFNRERAGAGAPPLRLSPVLAQVAQRQAEEMAGRGRLRSPAAETISERLQRVGYSAHDWREEYLVAPPPEEAVLASLRPRARSRVALDGQFRDLGVGSAVTADGGTLHVFLFGWHQGDYFAAATDGLGDRPRVAAEMLARVNDVRRRAGLRPLVGNPLLDRVSQAHAEDVLVRGYGGHESSRGLDPSQRARQAGYRSGIGENIVEQRFSVEEALEAWLGSPGHRRNLLDPGCREMGLGLALGGGYDAAPGGYRMVWVQSCGQGPM